MTTAIPEIQRNGIWLNPKQVAFLLSEQREVLYGGAAGGGKTDALLMAALQYVDQPNYHALILRRTYDSLWLAGSIGHRADEWLRKTNARWNGPKKWWRFPSGAVLQFGHLQTEHHADRYLSSDYQFIGIDELTEIKEANYTALLSRLRRKRFSRCPLRMRAASNPGGIGHDWVRERFMLKPGKRAFIPATVDDNQFLNREEYIETLKELPKALRDRFLYGDWDAQDTGLLSLETMLEAAVRGTLWPSERRVGGLGNPVYMGVDVGRTRDLTVVWIWERVQGVYVPRVVRTMRGVPFVEQQAVIESYLTIPGLIHCNIDRGGIGMHLAEMLVDRYPGLCVGVSLNDSNMGRLAVRLASLLESGRATVPDDEVVRRDFRLVRAPNWMGATPKISTNRDESGHADRFWAAALALESASVADNVPRTFKPRVVQ